MPDERDLLSHYIIDERPEYELNDQKLRFFCEFPGDAWTNGKLMNLVKKTLPRTDNYGNAIIAHLPKRITFDRFGNPTIATGRTKTFFFDQTSCELLVIEPHTVNGFLTDNRDIFLTVVALGCLRLFLSFADHFMERFGLKQKDRFSSQVEKITESRAAEFNKASKENNKQDLGVRFTDVAGVKYLIDDIVDVLGMMKGEHKWKEMGVKMPRGILLSGPPGTGKTLLAKAIAGEAGIPFYSANGSQFMEKFQGVCAARVRELFARARRQQEHGAIIFIDEIDALGHARATGSAGEGSAEREQGLLQLLVEMDGFRLNEKVLVLGATNRIKVIDKALMRPGRFDRVIHMGNPSRSGRIAILNLHAKTKRFFEPQKTEELLAEVSKITPGYSGAEIANVLNEAAILSVRDGKPGIDLAVILESIDKCKLGLPKRVLAMKQGKRRFVSTQTAKALLMASCAGIPSIERFILRSRGGFISRILIRPPVSTFQTTITRNVPCNGWENLKETPPINTAQIFQKYLTSFYASRAFEEILYGPGGTSLSTSSDIALGIKSTINFIAGFDTNLLREGNNSMRLGLIQSQLLEVSFIEAKYLITQKIGAISMVASAILDECDEMISGNVLLTTLDQYGNSDVNPELLERMIQSRKKVTNPRENFAKELYSNTMTIEKKVVKGRYQMVQNFKTRESAPFPAAQRPSNYSGTLLNDWMEMI
eukprot:gnl/MRDRNA2_/MRDRNA2_86643_c0_seq1.p1 gnl/MRDRNA2_/MRDRNA2_86643_c0~~gnl/MRDRNA2_/MRDRNA2_86643_c0_seq1.p1  ORF type:complete len:808 (+),score=38.91 gnl/MRDRNA2_/MRDRNA2_86643_c0_seq1:300-2426(+)